MTGPYPIYLLCGEDEFAIDEFIASHNFPASTDPTIASLNTSQLDGRIHSSEDLVKAVYGLPFMLDHRLVHLQHPTSLFKHPSHQKKLLDLMDKLPSTTQLILTEDHALTSDSDQKKGKIHWLERWARAAGEKVVFKLFPVPSGGKLIEWVMRRAEKAGGKFTSQGADELTLRTGSLPRMLDQEILKLLSYVNYSRAVEAGDVQQVTPFTAPVPDFALLNAIRTHNAREAFGILRRELEEKESLPILGSITQQFRHLLKVREIMDQGGRVEEVARLLHMHPFAAEKTMEHARSYSLAQIEAIYHRLLELDTAIKTGQIFDELALDLLLVELTNASR